MKLDFKTKAQTLALLAERLVHGRVLPQICFTVGEWEKLASDMAVIQYFPTWSKEVIVRSSAVNEDSATSSLAGHYRSIKNVGNKKELIDAIATVAKSMRGGDIDDEIFIQPMLRKVRVSGVAFTRNPNNGGHYYVINYDETSGGTDSVESGRSNKLGIRYHFKGAPIKHKGWLGKLLLLLQELEGLFLNDALDVEFAVVEAGIVLLQVRPLIINDKDCVTLRQQSKSLTEIENRFSSLSKPHPYLLGDKSIFGIMPDWNPAEMIGTRPRPLALSLYKELITDNIWAYQRDNYGYRNLRSFPLLISFAGSPYIDVRVSFNSFIPKELDEHLAHRLVNFYIDCLIQDPSLHDKVEFDIIYSCYTFDLPERLTELKRHGFKQKELKEIAHSLRHITNKIIRNDDGLWQADLKKINRLKQRQDTILSSSLPPVERIYWLLEDCKRYGTLPFAGLARAGFIAVQMLHSITRVGIFNTDEYHSFLCSIGTVSTDLFHDLSTLSQKEFLLRYGHLRPGAYDITTPSYEEEPERYFSWPNNHNFEFQHNGSTFHLAKHSLAQINLLLREHKIPHDAVSLLRFIKGAIAGREYAKFIFTRSLSEILRLVKKLGQKYHFDKDDMSYSEIDCFKQLYAASADHQQIISESITAGRRKYALTHSLSLPPLLTETDSIWSYDLPPSRPNFISMTSVTGKVIRLEIHKEGLSGNILMIPNADPGYDWIFAHDIGGFITEYGGANSHMAIRAAEMQIPAVIGAGKILFEKWLRARTLRIDCANQQVSVIS